MLKIRSADKLAQALLIELVETLTSAGAFFHPSLQLKIRGSEVNFSSRAKLKAGEQLVILPLGCMPLLNDFSWTLDDGQRLCYQTVDAPRATNYELHKQIVDLLVKLYQRLNKVAAYLNTSPVIQFVGKRPLLECLLAMDHDNALRAKLDDNLDHLMLASFWQGRAFTDHFTKQIHIIPIMDFFDHSIFADNLFWNSANGKERLLHHTFQPVGNSKEVFKRYDIMDNLCAFLQYGFVDDKAFFLQSQPFVLLLADKISLEIRYQSASGNQCHVNDWHVPPNYKNSIMYRARLEFLPDRVIIPFMLMPPQRHLPAFDEALAAQLQEIERHESMTNGSLSNSTVMREVKIAMLEKNENDYRALGQAAREAELDSTAPVTRLLKKMLSHQLKIINEFKQMVG